MLSIAASVTHSMATNHAIVRLLVVKESINLLTSFYTVTSNINNLLEYRAIILSTTHDEPYEMRVR